MFEDRDVATSEQRTCKQRRLDISHRSVFFADWGGRHGANVFCRVDIAEPNSFTGGWFDLLHLNAVK